MAESIRVNKGIVIGVNDDGDTIILDVNNTLFAERYVRMIEAIDEIQKSIDVDLKLSEKEEAKYITDKMRMVMKEIDKLFGEDACKKVFGEGVVPTVFAVRDFFEQLFPIVKKYSDKRQNEILTKYKARKGGKK